jgi:hypothetical protein
MILSMLIGMSFNEIMTQADSIYIVIYLRFHLHGEIQDQITNPPEQIRYQTRSTSPQLPLSLGGGGRAHRLLKFSCATHIH